MIATPPWDSLKGDLEWRRKLAWNEDYVQTVHLQAPLADATTCCKEKASSHKYMLGERPSRHGPWAILHLPCKSSLSGKCVLSELGSKTGFESIQTWSRATSSASSSLVTGPIQNRLQVVGYLSQPLLWLICLFLWPQCVHPFQATSFSCRHTDTLYFVSHTLEEKPLASTIPPAVLKSNGISPHSLLRSLCVCVQVWVLCAKNTILWLYIIFEVLTYTLLLLLWSGVVTLVAEIQHFRNDHYYYHYYVKCVCVCAIVGVVWEEYNDMTI